MGTPLEKHGKKGESGLMRAVRSVVPHVLRSTLEPPVTVGDRTEFIPSPDATGLDPINDAIVVKKSLGSPYATAPTPGTRLGMPTESMREAADRTNLIIDKARTRFLTGAAHVLTYPYVDLFDGMVPWIPERKGIFGDNGVRTVVRTDNVPYRDIKMSYETTLTYALAKDGKHLQHVGVYMGNNIDDDEAIPDMPRWLNGPHLEMTFENGMMTSVRLDIDPIRQRSIRMLTGKSLLGDFLRQELNTDRLYGGLGYGNRPATSLTIKLGKEMDVEIDQFSPGSLIQELETRFSWDPRQKIFKNFRADSSNSRRSTLSQSEFLQLLRDVLALVPATEEGSFDFARKQQVRAKSLIELVKEVEKLQRPSNEQFTALLQLMGSDSHQMYLQMGIDPDS